MSAAKKNPRPSTKNESDRPSRETHSAFHTGISPETTSGANDNKVESAASVIVAVAAVQMFRPAWIASGGMMAPAKMIRIRRASIIRDVGV